MVLPGLSHQVTSDTTYVYAMDYNSIIDVMKQ
jgi:hypothetical protein